MGVIFISSGQLWYANFQHFDPNIGVINGFFLNAHMPCRLEIKTILIRVHVHLGSLVVWIGQKPIKGKTPNIGVTNQEIEVGEYNKYSPHP